MDGDIHALPQEEDVSQEKTLKELGLRIVRHRNDELMNDLFAGMEKIRELVTK